MEEIALLGPEADNLKGGGKSLDDDSDPGHYLDIGDDGRIAGAVILKEFPPNREAYDTLLRGAGTDEYKMGFLPYALIDGFEIVRKDLAYWRVADVGARTAANPGDRAAFARVRVLRELLTIRDIGYWSHFVGDGSQPLHLTVHYNGWEERYPGSRGLHARFETAYVERYLSEPQVRARMGSLARCGCAIQQAIVTYLLATNAQVEPLYALFREGAFEARTDAGVDFVAGRLAFGASELRDLIVDAWEESEDQSVGYPPKRVRDVESGAVPLTRAVLHAE
ncbi:MAG: S1/P1 Nuclease [Candidatus Eremiobacteraeota bacterium]|nr:S1/P1 Nuclease [Candidatus Eremiobacteraeota bacterium]